MICKECKADKFIERFGQWRYKDRYGAEQIRRRNTCNACRSAIEKHRVTNAKREEFRRLTSWPVPQ